MTKQFTKADMKSGCVALLRDGSWCAWRVCWSFNNSNFNDDLTHKRNHEYDIMLAVSPDGEVLFKREEPKTVVINGIEVPAGAIEQLEWRQNYYCPSLISPYFVKSYWIGREIDFQYLERGIVHLTKENAIDMSKAMLAFEKGYFGRDDRATALAKLCIRSLP